MNKLLKTATLLFIICNLANGQTKLSLLGTIHDEQIKINSQAVLKAITTFYPDVILYEADTISLCLVFRLSTCVKRSSDRNLKILLPKSISCLDISKLLKIESRCKITETNYFLSKNLHLLPN